MKTETSYETHAAHYAYSHPAKGHDLAWFHVQAPKLRDCVNAKIPFGFKYHSGFLRNGEQWWSFYKRMPLSVGTCRHCR